MTIRRLSLGASCCLVLLASLGQAMEIHKSSSSLAKSKDGRSELFEDDSSGPESGGSIDFRVEGPEARLFAISNDFSPGDGTRPQRVTEQACRAALADLAALLKKRGFEGVTTHPEACAGRHRGGAVSVTDPLLPR